MGGFGSGRPRTRTNGTIEASRSLDIGKLNRCDALVDGWKGNWLWSRDGKEIARIGLAMRNGSLGLSYRFRRVGGEWEPVEQTVPIQWRPCRFGGQRPYFQCRGVINGHACSRTVTRLFGSDKFFLCRRCYRLSYGSQHEACWDRALRLANKIRSKLGGDPGSASMFPRRPKGMRHQTYYRLQEKVIEAESRADERLEIMAARLMNISHSRSAARVRRGGRFW